ncbi:MAG: zinc-ribbon domain-containing protein [Myxococcota bacterium]|nr:zinc-ribbon domain-containing protein [Myxococcota bacterium]
MKFLCDRCKTRYSIGDDRVRGKILKIRCKNCNNVITVREGMPDVADGPSAGRAHTTTQAVPLASELPGPGAPPGPSPGALGAAFASAMTKPPPALEEEWYVSIDGDQSGPFSLAEAQRWVAGKAIDADLHCWSEGFDDWLPVDKVSHFRGLRKKPAPPAPPPRPTGPVRAVSRPIPVVAPVEEEPKPLFAATMASLEKGVPSEPVGGRGAYGIPSLKSASASVAPAAAIPTLGRTNGSAATSAAGGTPAGRPTPEPATRPPGVPATSSGAISAKSGGTSSSGPINARGTASAKAFDASDSATQVEAFGSAPAAHEPNESSNWASATNDAFIDALGAAPVVDGAKHGAGIPASGAMPSAGSAGEGGGDDDLDIGEVSRVVNLADLARSAPRRISSPMMATNKPGAIQRATGTMAAVGRISSTSLAAIGAGPADPSLPVDPNAPAPAPMAKDFTVSHRRGMIALMLGAVLLLGVAGAVLLLVSSDDDSISGGLGQVGDVDTTRPDDPIRRPGTNGVVADTSQNPFVPKKPIYRPPVNTNPIHVPTTNPDAKALRPDEIEEMAGKYSGTTQRCYIRSQRGADAILIGDVKKIGVTLTVNKDGAVTNVALSDHASNSLGKCLITSIKGWKFRASTAGITARITMVFQSG